MTDRQRLVVIGYERSGVLRRAVQSLGHLAISIDLEPSDDDAKGWHMQGDLFASLDQLPSPPDAAVFHPPCTFLTNSAAWALGDGPYHQQIRPGTLVGAARRAARDEALNTVRRLAALPIPRIVIENPPGAISTHVMRPTQIIHPWQFGDDASKATALYTVNVPPLPIDPRDAIAPRLINGRPRWSNQTDSGQNRLSPAPDRAARRAQTYTGIAAALARHLIALTEGDDTP